MREIQPHMRVFSKRTRSIRVANLKQLIKEVKTVQNRTRKVFMLFDVEPAAEVSGGTWYHEGLFFLWMPSRCDRGYDGRV